MDRARLEEIRRRVEEAVSALEHGEHSLYYPFDDMVELLDYVEELEKKLKRYEQGVPVFCEV